MSTELIIIAVFILIALICVTLYFIAASRKWHENQQNELKRKPIYSQVVHHLSKLGVPEYKGAAVVQEFSQMIDAEINRETHRVYQEMGKIIEVKDKKVAEIQNRVETVERSYETLGKQKGQTESVVRSIAKGVIVLDDDGKVVYVNETAEKILGSDQNNLIGQKISGMEGSHVVSMINEDGSEVKMSNQKDKEDIKENMAVIETVHGQTKGMISISPNRDPSQKVESFKNEFLANITHEFRSPLICIQKSLQVLSEHNHPEDQQYLNIAARNASRLEKLVNDILDLSKLESGQIRLRHEIFTLAPFIEEIRWNFYAWANEKKIQIDVEIPDNVTVLEGDRYRLGQVFSNFISNAIKFTPREGRITLCVKKREKNPDRPEIPEMIEIGVKDTGTGIDPEEQKNIFKKFAHVSTHPTEGEKGTGIGLSIAKGIVDLHKGRIWAESKAGQGSYFAFAVPLRKP